MLQQPDPFETKMVEKFLNLHGKIPSPLCAICNKQVDKMGIHFRPFDEKYIVKIECHGDQAEVRIPEKYALNPKFSIQMGTAFVPNQTNRQDGIVTTEIS